MIEVICQHCGKKFEAKQRNRKFCSDTCRNKNHYHNQSYEQRLRHKILASLKRHRHDGFQVNGSVDEYIDTFTAECALCGEKFDIFSSDKMKSGSLDRISNGNVIQPDDVQWLCYNCNATKHNRSNKEFYEYIMKILPKLEEVVHNE